MKAHRGHGDRDGGIQGEFRPRRIKGFPVKFMGEETQKDGKRIAWFAHFRYSHKPSHPDKAYTTPKPDSNDGTVVDWIPVVIGVIVLVIIAVACWGPVLHFYQNM